MNEPHTRRYTQKALVESDLLNCEPRGIGGEEEDCRRPGLVGG